jgi:hypothetical protein
MASDETIRDVHGQPREDERPRQNAQPEQDHPGPTRYPPPLENSKQEVFQPPSVLHDLSRCQTIWSSFIYLDINIPASTPAREELDIFNPMAPKKNHDHQTSFPLGTIVFAFAVALLPGRSHVTYVQM